MTTAVGPGPFEPGARLQSKEDPENKFYLLEYLGDDMLYVDFGDSQGLIALADVEAAAVSHYLVVTKIDDGLEPECEWEIEHPPECQPVDFEICMIGAEFDAAGLDAIGGESELPPPGRYPLIGHAMSSPSTWMSGPEHWVEIEVLAP